MAKSGKKKKEKAADFTKAKLKLGKGKQVASNAVDTSFKARTIALPGQSIVVTKDESQPLTKRKQSLEDLLTHLKHYGAAVRRDALSGIHELIEEHPSLLDTSLFTIVNGCSRLIADEDHSVRRALISLLRRLFSLASVDSIRPHAHVLLLFTASALTHIFPEIRVDAIKALNIFLQYVPDMVTAGWASQGVESSTGGPGRKLLQGYLGLLNLSHSDSSQTDVYVPAMSAVTLSTATRAEILGSLATFMECAMGYRLVDDEGFHSGISTDCFESLFPSRSTFESFVALLSPSRSAGPSSRAEWKAAVDATGLDDGSPFFSFEADAWSISDLARTKDFEADVQLSDPRLDVEFHLLETLQPLVSSVFSETAPQIFAPSNSAIPETETRMLSSSIRLGILLYKDLIKSRASLSSSRRGKINELLAAYLGQVAAYFPFSSGSLVKRDIQIEAMVQELNIRYCELVNCAIQLQMGLDQIMRLPPKLHRHAVDVLDYMSKLLEGEGGVVLTAQHYRSVVPSVVTLLSVQETLLDRDELVDVDLYHAILRHDAGLSTQSSLKRFSNELIARLVLLGSSSNRASAGLKPKEQHYEDLRGWLIKIPRTLWETGRNNNWGSELLLLLLLRTIQRSPCWINLETLKSLCTRLTPYFVVNHGQKGQLDGPFSRLGERMLRLLALDLVEVILSDQSVRLTAEAAALRRAVAQAKASV